MELSSLKMVTFLVAPGRGYLSLTYGQGEGRSPLLPQVSSLTPQALLSKIRSIRGSFPSLSEAMIAASINTTRQYWDWHRTLEFAIPLMSCSRV